MQTVLSGAQPSGSLTIGNYFGAIKNWLNLIENNDCYFMIADLHAITQKQNPKELYKNTLDLLAVYLACGISFEKCTIFLQSKIKEHTQLAWLLNCYTPLGELNRMTQFKDKSSRNAKNINLGLFAYPVLQAADILLYQADKIPVGEDQKQHIELTRNIAIRFNQAYGNIFKIPSEEYLKNSSKIMSLGDLQKKMSKSDKNPNNFLLVLEDEQTAIKKIKRAITDSENKIYYDKEKKPAVSNLLEIIASLEQKKIQDVASSYEDKNYGFLKNSLIEQYLAYFSPIKERYNQIRDDETFLLNQLKNSTEKAKERAKETLEKVQKAIGFCCF